MKKKKRNINEIMKKKRKAKISEKKKEVKKIFMKW